LIQQARAFIARHLWGRSRPKSSARCWASQLNSPHIRQFDHLPFSSTGAFCLHQSFRRWTWAGVPER
jgi:hypothetical protein